MLKIMPLPWARTQALHAEIPSSEQDSARDVGDDMGYNGDSTSCPAAAREERNSACSQRY